MDYLIEAFEPAFMQRALIGGLIAVVATSFVGTWVVLRGLAFLGDALAHGVIPGVALAGLWGFNPLIGAFAAALVMSGLVSVVSTRTIVRDETAIGLLFVGMLSLGIIVISTAPSFATDVSGLLFGDILGVTRADIRTQAIVAAVVTVAMFVLYRPLMALAFNRSKATTLRMHPALTHAALLGLLTEHRCQLPSDWHHARLWVDRGSTSNRVATGAAGSANHGALDAARRPVRRRWPRHPLPPRHRPWSHHHRAQRCPVFCHLHWQRSEALPPKSALCDRSTGRLAERNRHERFRNTKDPSTAVTTADPSIPKPRRAPRPTTQMPKQT